MAELVPFRTMATYIAGSTDQWYGSTRDRWVNRGQVLELTANLIGLAKHTCLLAWKNPAAMTPPPHCVAPSRLKAGVGLRLPHRLQA